MVYHHNVFEPWPMEDRSVQAIITSPPYWGKRKYDIPDVEIYETGFVGQHGLEPTVEQYIEHAMIWLAEAWRVLRADGLLFLNIGDTYGGSWGATSKDGINPGKNNQMRRCIEAQPPRPPQRNYRKKSLLLIPERLKVAMFDAGWYFRNNIIWHKPNGLGDSAGDRFTGRHEDIFLCAKSEQYLSNLDDVRKPYKPDSFRRMKSGYKPMDIPEEAMPGRSKPHSRTWKAHPKGANPGDVWKISCERRPGLGHYAIFPEEVVKRMMLFSSIKGDTVLDPFVGSGTVLSVAAATDRKGIGFDLGYKDVRRRRLGLLAPKEGSAV